MQLLQVGRRLIVLHQGDITTVPAEVIVNAANDALVGGGGVDGAVHRVGGPAILADLRRRYGVDRHCPAGGAVISTAGSLPARWVVHAVGPIWHGGQDGEPALLGSAYRMALRLAREVSARSVALPAISTGAYGYPLPAAARIAVEAARDHLAGVTTIERLTFVLFSRDTYEAFESALDGLSSAAAE